jgi:hypothetical protein
LPARAYRPRLEPLEFRDLPRTPFEAPGLGPPPAPGPDAVWVGTEPELQAAVANLRSGQTVVVRPGTYDLTRPLYVGKNAPVQNVAIRGATDDFNDVVIRGAGMDNPAVPFGISVYNAQDVLVANLSVGQVYYHALDLQGGAGAERVRAFHNRFFDAGEQILKSNAGGGGADDCVLEYNLVEFTAGPSVVDHGGGTGYTGGLHAHETDRWVIRHNLWRNVHTPDWVTHTFAPTVLMWNYSADTVVEGNTFVDCDRAVAFGLVDRPAGTDHRGGVVRNNFVYQRPGLFSADRRTASDGQLLAYDSPGTVIAHNTVLTNGNSRFSLEVRWAGVEFRNNLTDAPYRGRDGGTYAESGNVTTATPDLFVNPAAADLHLRDTAAARALAIDRAVSAYGVGVDFDGAGRPSGGGSDVGADELVVAPGASAVLVGQDSASQGNWARVGGADGYLIARGAAAVPGYATAAVSGAASWTWAGATADPRALRTPGAADRLAACWYAPGSFAVALDLAGGPRRVSAYFLDWDGGGRAQRVEVLDAATGAVLDARAVSGFGGGTYLTWDLAGAVVLRVTRTAGPNAVLSGLFFGAPPAPPPSSSATYVGADATTSGGWVGRYGAEGYALSQGAAAVPGYATAAVSGAASWTWAGATADPRALRTPGAADRLAACWYAPGSFTVDLAVSGGHRRVSAYFLDWDAMGGGRAQRVEVLDAATGAVLDTRVLTDFQGGAYLTWDLAGAVKIRVTTLNPAANAVLSGLFFG